MWYDLGKPFTWCKISIWVIGIMWKSELSSFENFLLRPSVILVWSSKAIKIMKNIQIMLLISSILPFHSVQHVTGFHKLPCQCNIVVCTISKEVVCTVHTTILHWHENPMCAYNIFHLQFHKCYLLFEYKLLFKQCNILCQLRQRKLISKSAVLNFWLIAGFWRKSYVSHTTILHKPE